MAQGELGGRACPVASQGGELVGAIGVLGWQRHDAFSGQVREDVPPVPA